MDTGKFFINLLLTNNKGILINHYIRTIKIWEVIRKIKEEAFHLHQHRKQK